MSVARSHTVTVDALRLNVAQWDPANGGPMVKLHDIRGESDWDPQQRDCTDSRLNPDPARAVDLMPHGRALQCPTLVVRGARSDYQQPDMAQAMCDANPLIHWSEIAVAGHYIHDDQPESFQRLLDSFLARVEPTGRLRP